MKFIRKRPENPEESALFLREGRAFLFLALLALADTLVIELCNHKVFTDGFEAFFAFLLHHPLALLVNFLIVLVTLVPAMFLRRRVFWCALMSAIWLGGGAANGFILLNRMTPFTIADLTVLNSGLDTLPNYLSKQTIVLLAAAIILVLAGLVLLFWKGPRNAVESRRRILSGMMSLLLVGGLLTGGGVLAFKTAQLSTVFSNLAFAYTDYGFSYCFLQTWLNKGIARPLDYQEQAVRAVEDRVEKNLPEKGAPLQTDVNVVYVQLESFIDPETVKGLKLSEEAIPVWRDLTEHYTTGYFRVPVVGAGTANTEFEVLTGMSARFFGPGEYPYKTRMPDRTAETVAYNLKEHGYGTHAIHNHRATFYGRNHVYANLGFDDFTPLEYMPKVKKTPKNWAKDEILTSQILKALDATPDQPDVVFTVSVQGHGKYPQEPILEDPAITVEECPVEGYEYAFEYFVNQIHEMDQFVGELTAALEAREEKTILVLYGDHLPALGLEDQDMTSGSLYDTTYVMWDNFGLHKEDKDLAAYQVSAEVLKRMGVTTGFFNRYHQSCQEEETYLQDLKLLQYDTLYGQRYLYDGEIPYERTEMQMGMEPIRITALNPWGDNWMISGKNFTPFCKVSVDGKQLKTSYRSSQILCLKEDPKTEDFHDLTIQVVDKHKEILGEFIEDVE